MEALSGSQSLEGLIQSRKVARWAGCSAKTFADAVVARLETLCETESYKADVLGKKAGCRLKMWLMCSCGGGRRSEKRVEALLADELAEEDPAGERSCEKDDGLAEVHRKR